MKTGALRVSLLLGITLVLAGAAQTDTVTMTTNGNRHCFKVGACPAGRAAGDTRNIHDFHVRLDVSGTIISHSSPSEWSGSHGQRSASWKTTTRPIKYTAAGANSRSGFCIKVDGGDRLRWKTTAKDGTTIAQGVIPLP